MPFWGNAVQRILRGKVLTNVLPPPKKLTSEYNMLTSTKHAVIAEMHENTWTEGKLYMCMYTGMHINNKHVFTFTCLHGV